MPRPQKISNRRSARSPPGHSWRVSGRTANRPRPAPARCPPLLQRATGCGGRRWRVERGDGGYGQDVVRLEVSPELRFLLPTRWRRDGGGFRGPRCHARAPRAERRCPAHRGGGAPRRRPGRPDRPEAGGRRAGRGRRPRATAAWTARPDCCSTSISARSPGGCGCSVWIPRTATTPPTPTWSSRPAGRTGCSSPGTVACFGGGPCAGRRTCAATARTTSSRTCWIGSGSRWRRTRGAPHAAAISDRCPRPRSSTCWSPVRGAARDRPLPVLRPCLLAWRPRRPPRPARPPAPRRSATPRRRPRRV